MSNPLREISLRPITKDNLEDCCRLRVAPEQDDFVERNVGSLAEAYVTPEYHPLAVYDGEQMVGFTMYGEETPGRWWVIRLMVDQRFQGRGYGKAAMLALIDLMRERHGCDEIVTSDVPGNPIAEGLYVGLGFRATGEIDEDEIVMLLDLNA